MDIGLILKIAAVGLIVSILNQILLRAEKGEYAMLTTLMGVIVVLMMLIPQLRALLASVQALMDF